jgi:coenzyme F420 hydrogenase subunit beta
MKLSTLKNDNIDFVVKQHLCTSCGTCAGVCSREAIKFHLNKFGVYVPLIDNKLCTQCGLCLRVCPGHSFDYVKHCKRLHGELPDHAALGANLAAYAGHTTDENILRLSQSGGFVSTLLLFCIEKGIVNGAVVTGYRKDSPLEPRTYIARNREEILAAVGSKYIPVPASRTVRKILKEPGRFAFVGTPCQIQGMRKAETEIPKLADKIGLYIGLHCLGVFTYHFYDQILHKVGLRREELSYFHHRDKAWRGWQGDLHIKDTQGKSYHIDARNSRRWPRPYFMNWRCLQCFDKGNEFSDVSCGDGRIPDGLRFFEEKGYDLKKGLSEFVIRTERGSQVVSQAIEEAKYIVHRTDADSIASSIGVAGKKIGLNTFKKVAKIFRVGVPEYGVRFEPPQLNRSRRRGLLKIWTIAYSIQYYVAFTLLQYDAVRWIMKRIPHKVLGKLNSKCKKGAEWVKFAKSTNLEIICKKKPE